MSTVSKKTAKALLALTLLFSQIILPFEVYAETTNSGPALNWSAPDSGSNPFKLSSSVVTPQLLTSVVSCTGLPDKLASKFIVLNQKFQQELDKLVKKATDALKKLVVSKAKRVAEEKALEAARKAALATTATAGTAASTTAAGSGTPGAAVSIMGVATDIPHASTTKVELTAEEQKKVDQAKADQEAAANKIAQKQAADKCLNGIAIRLARNQLTAMTRDTMNWVSKGFNGNPLFVRNVDDFMDGLQKDIIKKETDYFVKLSKENDQRYPYARDIAKQQIATYQASKDPVSPIASDMRNYLPRGATIDSFSKDFSKGGWGAWLAFTQHPTNNPLGAIMVATEAQNEKINTATTNAQNEIDRNGGYVDQRKCVQWSKDVNNGWTTTSGTNTCLKYETVTPGTAIRDKINKATNLPESQLELVKTIDDALNSLFGALLSKFQNQGLSSLGTTSVSLSDLSGGFDANGNPTGSSGFGSGSDGSFDITKDLGNTYTKATNAGTWNASTNTPYLSKGVGVKNQYYTVSVAGGTDIVTNADYWNKGDKVFFNGTAWQSGVPKYIIEKRGSLQVQQDYIDNVTVVQTVLPNVLKSLGALDYCIPGPNPGWTSDLSDDIDAIIKKEQELERPHQSDEMVEKYWSDVTNKFIPEYKAKIDALYGSTSPMQTPYLPNGDDNKSFLGMAQIGLSMTRNLKEDADLIDESTQAYKDAGIQTQGNIYRLNKIKDKMNIIIAAAQKRRDTKRLQAGSPKVTQECLDTEKVTYVVNGVLK